MAMRRLGIVSLLVLGSVILYARPQSTPFSSNFASVPTAVRGIFATFPNPHSSADWNPYILNLIKDTVPGQTFTPLIKGAAGLVTWNQVATAGPTTLGGTPTYVGGDTALTTIVNDWDTCNGGCTPAPHKQTLIQIATTSYNDPGAGVFNAGLPTWFTNRIATTAISRASNVITVTVAGGTPFRMFVGSLTSPAQSIQILGATPSDLNGIWTICTMPTAGCSAPTNTQITATSSGANESASVQGTVGNPSMDFDNNALSLPSDLCGNGGIPVWWSQNFINAYRDMVNHELTLWGGDSRIAGFKIGFGIGFENYPGRQNGRTNSSNCRTVLEAAGYPAKGSDPLPADAGGAWWVSTYLLPQITWLTGLGLTTKPLWVPLSYTDFGPNPDTPNVVAQGVNNNAAKLSFSSEGLSIQDIGYFFPGQTCDNNSCLIFDLYRGLRPSDWQWLHLTDPTCATDTTTCSMVPAMNFAIGRGVQLIEIYTPDAECTQSGYNGVTYGRPAYNVFNNGSGGGCSFPWAGSPSAGGYQGLNYLQTLNRAAAVLNQ